MSDSLGHKAATGAIWASIDRFGQMALSFIVNLILARLLIPADFGAIGMLAIFIAVSQTLMDGGFGSALIQKKEPTQTDYSTIFFWNVLFSVLLYLILYFSAPYISEFYRMPILCAVLRIIGLTLIINGILTIQRNKLQKQLAFRTIAITDIVSYIIGATAAIYMAYNSYGVWSLVMLTILSGISGIIILWIMTRWHPSLVFSKASMRELFGFGGYIMAANLLQTICQNLQGLLIGRKFSATQMGYYSQAYKLDQISSYSIPQVLVQVMYPVYSSIQDDLDRLQEMVLMNIRVISFIVFPILSILIIIANPLVELLYGAEWLPCVPYFKILCIGGFFVCLQNINFYAIAAVGKSKNLFYCSFYKWGFLLAALLIGMMFGMYGIMWGMVASAINIFIVNALLAEHHIGLSVIRQIIALWPSLVLSLLSLGVTILFDRYLFSNITINLISFISIYSIIAYCSRVKALTDTFTLSRKLLNR